MLTIKRTRELVKKSTKLSLNIYKVLQEKINILNIDNHIQTVTIYRTDIGICKSHDRYASHVVTINKC